MAARCSADILWVIEVSGFERMSRSWMSSTGGRDPSLILRFRPFNSTCGIAMREKNGSDGCVLSKGMVGITHAVEWDDKASRTIMNHIQFGLDVVGPPNSCLEWLGIFSRWLFLPRSLRHALNDELVGWPNEGGWHLSPLLIAPRWGRDNFKLRWRWVMRKDSSYGSTGIQCPLCTILLNQT